MAGEEKVNGAALPARCAAFAALAVEAGGVVMRFYEEGCGARSKADQSPVTDADVAAEAVIVQGLARRLPDVPVIAEEAVAGGQTPAPAARFVLVDPLDGTREFIGRNGEFTVNIALIEHGAPTVGAVFAPALGLLWLGEAGFGAWLCEARAGADVAAWPRRAIVVRRPGAQWAALASRSHGDPQTEALLASWPIGARIAAGSSLKFCRIAEGVADVYPRCGPTMEWDTAAGDAVLRAAGGMVTDLDASPLRYGKAAFRNGPFVAWGGQPPRACDAAAI